MDPLTYELYGLQEPAADVLFMVVLHGDAFVLVCSLKVIGTVRRHIQQRWDPHVVQDLLLGGVESAAQIQEGENLHGAALEEAQMEESFVITSLLQTVINHLCPREGDVKGRQGRQVRGWRPYIQEHQTLSLEQWSALWVSWFPGRTERKLLHHLENKHSALKDVKWSVMLRWRC